MQLQVRERVRVARRRPDEAALDRRVLLSMRRSREEVEVERSGALRVLANLVRRDLGEDVRLVSGLFRGCLGIDLMLATVEVQRVTPHAVNGRPYQPAEAAPARRWRLHPRSGVVVVLTPAV